MEHPKSHRAQEPSALTRTLLLLRSQWATSGLWTPARQRKEQTNQTMHLKYTEDSGIIGTFRKNEQKWFRGENMPRMWGKSVRRGSKMHTLVHSLDGSVFKKEICLFQNNKPHSWEQSTKSSAWTSPSLHQALTVITNFTRTLILSPSTFCHCYNWIHENRQAPSELLQESWTSPSLISATALNHELHLNVNTIKASLELL